MKATFRVDPAELQVFLTELCRIVPEVEVYGQIRWNGDDGTITLTRDFEYEERLRRDDIAKVVSKALLDDAMETLRNWQTVGGKVVVEKLAVRGSG